MKLGLIRTILCAFFAILSAPAQAELNGFSIFARDDVTICPGQAGQDQPPDFNAPDCYQGSAQDIDPQGTMIWVRTSIHLADRIGPDGSPLSLYVSGKMSSHAWLNGQLVGKNGTPGDNADSEIPGTMDAEFFPPQDLFANGKNEVVLLLSSHHGAVKLYRPLHWIAIGPTGRLGQNVFAPPGPALVTLGLFLLGATYFGVVAVLTKPRGSFATLSALCIFAAGQLVSETLRSLVQYSYPLHDYRLIAIALFSAAFGLGVCYQVLRNFNMPRIGAAMAGLCAISSMALIFVPGFDFKALISMIAPMTVGLIATGYWTYKGSRRAFVYFLLLLVFVAASVIFRGLFLDTVFFLLVALFLLILFVDQAMSLAYERRERRSEEMRANRLEQALAAASQGSQEDYISIKSAGRVERVALQDIVHCKGAGGYCELALKDGRNILHSATLNELEETLSATFLRVHRSHLINVTYVQSLSRAPSGTGTLILDDNSEIPVSRRIMPRVREALA